MSLFDDSDSFDSIVREFFGENARNRSGTRRKTFISSEDDERVIDFIEDETKSYLIFELPGYNSEDVSVKIDGRVLYIIAQKTDFEGVKEYLSEKLTRGMKLRKNLPEFINTKGFEHTLINGILEITFDKKKNN